VVAGLDHDVAAAWWPAGPESQVPEDLLAPRRVLDDGDQPPDGTPDTMACFIALLPK